MSYQLTIDNFLKNNLVKNQYSLSYITVDGNIEYLPNAIDYKFSGPTKSDCLYYKKSTQDSKITMNNGTCTSLRSQLLYVYIDPNPDKKYPYITISIYDNDNKELNINDPANYLNATYLIITQNPPIPNEGISIWYIIIAILLVIGVIWYFFFRKSEPSTKLNNNSNYNSNYNSNHNYKKLKGGIFYMGE
jgi:ATP-dependent Zn protease